MRSCEPQGVNVTAVGASPPLEGIWGRITDVDSHEHTPVTLWPERFGRVGTLFAPVGAAFGQDVNDPNCINLDTRHEGTEISDENIWNLRPRALAPGAFELDRRLAVLDHIGIERQLLFPGFAFIAMFVRTRSEQDEAALASYAVPGADIGSIVANIGELAWEVTQSHNNWAMEIAHMGPRLRPVAMIIADEMSSVMSELERVLVGGLRAVWLSSSLPPGGRSPAHADIDPFWSMLEEADASFLLHVGGEHAFMRSSEWRNVPIFTPRTRTLEASVDPYFFSTQHMASLHYLLVMALGGVFERHPRLRVGAIEHGAQWIGPLAEALDMWVEQSPGLRATLSMRPSEYIARNVRVTPFHFEHVERYVERYGMEDVYCFSTDYPHVEGGRRPIGDFAERLTGLGASFIEKFFVTNGQLLFGAPFQS
jgi:predicted TIM-barrel fold metal-dependent hydrolase